MSIRPASLQGHAKCHHRLTWCLILDHAIIYHTGVAIWWRLWWMIAMLWLRGFWYKVALMNVMAVLRFSRFFSHLWAPWRFELTQKRKILKLHKVPVLFQNQLRTFEIGWQFLTYIQHNFKTAQISKLHRTNTCTCIYRYFACVCLSLDFLAVILGLACFFAKKVHCKHQQRFKP